MRLQQGKEENGNSIMLSMNLQVSLGKGEKFPVFKLFLNKRTHASFVRLDSIFIMHWSSMPTLKAFVPVALIELKGHFPDTS